MTNLSASSISVSGDVSGTWEVDSVLVTEDITIANGNSLTISSGTYIEFQGHYGLHVQGRLLAIGSVADSILFTVNDTTGFSNTNTTDGSWHGIRFIETSSANDSSKISYCRLQYGKAIGYSPPSAGSGGAICASGFSKIAVTNSIICHNMAFTGAGIALENYSGGTYKNNLFQNNAAWLQGGGLYCASSLPLVDNCVFRENSASSGAGISLWYNSDAVLRNLLVENNEADIHAGGIYCNFGSSPVIENVIIRENTATYGAGINCHEGASPFIFRTQITGNHAATSAGGISCGINANATMVNVTLCDNTALFWGSAMYIYDSHPVFINSIIRNDLLQEIYFSNYDQYSQSILLANNDLQGGIESIITNENATIHWLSGNMSEPPQFEPDSFDYQLLETSPCIDMGTEYFEWQGNTIVDLDQSSYIGIAPDMGAWEYTELQDCIYGDLNQDETVDILDILVTVNIIIGNIDPTDFQLCAADPNQDGTIDILDIIIVVDMIMAG